MMGNFQEWDKEEENEEAFAIQDEWGIIENDNIASDKERKPEFDLFGTALNEL